MHTDIERYFCAPPSGNCCNAEIRHCVCGCDFPRQTPSFGTAGISLTKHRINAILIHGKRSGAGLHRDVEAAFLTRPAIIRFLDKMVSAVFAGNRYCTANFTGLCPERHSPVRMTKMLQTFSSNIQYKYKTETVLFVYFRGLFLPSFKEGRRERIRRQGDFGCL